jgi:hypothetical protein
MNGTVQKTERKPFDWKWFIGISVPVVALLIAFGWNTIKSWGSNKADEALMNERICHKIDSMCIDGIEKQKQINEINIEIDDFKQTMLEYAERQDKMYNEVKEDQRLQKKILKKMDAKLNVAGDLIQELTDKQEQVNNTLNQ